MVDKPITLRLQFDPLSFALDLYRLLCMFLADKRVVSVDPNPYSEPLELRSEFLRGEVLRILISSSVALRIAFDQDQEFKSLKTNCGKLYPKWPKGKQKAESLTLREACNKIIHAEKIQYDFHEPAAVDPYLRPYVYLYGKKDGREWRAKLSIIGFVKWGAIVFLKIAGRR
jgi:hypothetical protein